MLGLLSHSTTDAQKSTTEAFNERKAKEETAVETQSTSTAQRSDLPPSRQGKTQLTAWVTPEVAKQIGHIAVDENVSKERVVCNALNELFTKMGLPPIA